MTVLVLARNFDPTADAAMAAWLKHQVPVLRTDLAAFPRQLRRDAGCSSGGGPAGWATNITRSRWRRFGRSGTAVPDVSQDCQRSRRGST